MIQPLLHTLAYLLLSLSLAAVVWLFAGSHAAWATLCGGLLLQLAYHLRQWQLLERWSRAPGPERELDGSGIWSELFSRVHRHERELRREVVHWQNELAHFAAAGQALTVGVVIVDHAWRIEWCNRMAAQQLGLDPRADLGNPITHLLRQPPFLDYLARADFSAPLKIRAAYDGQAQLSLFIIDYGQHRRLIQIADITQSERLEQMRRDFVANVSHELRTPLTVLSGFLETLRELELDPAARTQYLGIMGEQATRMQRIVEELLILSSMEAAPPPPLHERIDMATLLQQLLHDAEALSAGQHQITLRLSGQADLFGAENEIRSALGNLVSNAVRYTPAGGQVRLSWHSDAQGAVFAVEDSGIGIDAAHLPRLTERFYRVDRGRSRASGGTGLGLAIVKHAVARHQATLQISSQPGQGSRFAIHFPPGRLAPPAT